MTRAEAIRAAQVALMDTGVDAVRVHHTLEDCKECERLSRLVLDAIGFDTMQQQLEQARALAKQLADSLKDSGADGHPAHTYEHQDCGLCAEGAAIAAYEAASKEWS